jgi:hypothetical protein
LHRTVDRFEPGALPEDQATGLTSAVGLPVAADVEMHSIGQASAYIVAADSIAGLVGALVNTETLTAVLKHLRHERESVEATILVECAKNFLLAPNLYPVACTRVHVNIPIRSGNVTSELQTQERSDKPTFSSPPLWRKVHRHAAD